MAARNPILRGTIRRVQSRQGRILYIHAPRMRTPPPARRLAGASPRLLPRDASEPPTGPPRGPGARRRRAGKSGAGRSRGRGAAIGGAEIGKRRVGRAANISSPGPFGAVAARWTCTSRLHVPSGPARPATSRLLGPAWRRLLDPL
jgi:hypothetical protein